MYKFKRIFEKHEYLMKKEVFFARRNNIHHSNVIYLKHQKIQVYSIKLALNEKDDLNDYVISLRMKSD